MLEYIKNIGAILEEMQKLLNMNFIKIYGYNASLEYTPTILVNMNGIDSSYSIYFSSTKQIDYTINYLNNL